MFLLFALVRGKCRRTLEFLKICKFLGEQPSWANIKNFNFSQINTTINKLLIAVAIPFIALHPYWETKFNIKM
jgi:hypothetical protein